MHRILVPFSQGSYHINDVFRVGGIRQVHGKLIRFPDLFFSCRLFVGLRGRDDLYNRNRLLLPCHTGAFHRMYMLRNLADQLTALCGFQIAGGTVLVLRQSAGGFVCQGDAHAPQQPRH